MWGRFTRCSLLMGYHQIEKIVKPSILIDLNENLNRKHLKNLLLLDNIKSSIDLLAEISFLIVFLFPSTGALKLRIWFITQVYHEKTLTIWITGK